MALLRHSAGYTNKRERKAGAAHNGLINFIWHAKIYALRNILHGTTSQAMHAKGFEQYNVARVKGACEVYNYNSWMKTHIFGYLSYSEA